MIPLHFRHNGCRGDDLYFVVSADNCPLIDKFPRREERSVKKKARLFGTNVESPQKPFYSQTRGRRDAFFINDGVSYKGDTVAQLLPSLKCAYFCEPFFPLLFCELF